MIDPFYFIDLPIYASLGLGAYAVHRFRNGKPSDKQSWRMTMVEVFTGKVVGVAISYCMNLFLLPLIVNADISPRDAALISSLYLAVATVRSLITRRVFEHLRVKGVGQ